VAPQGCADELNGCLQLVSVELKATEAVDNRAAGEKPRRVKPGKSWPFSKVRCFLLEQTFDLLTGSVTLRRSPSLYSSVQKASHALAANPDGDLSADLDRAIIGVMPEHIWQNAIQRWWKGRAFVPASSSL
jgi:hypothetical protein